MSLFRYFDRIEIIHLPERKDRFMALEAELKAVGLDINDPLVFIPPAPRPHDADGFPSVGVRGNFLSHLDILKRAHADNLNSVLILEDDCIFSDQLLKTQEKVVEALASRQWGTFFIGHSQPEGLRKDPSGVVQFQGDSLWAHCYAVSKLALPRMIAYFESTMVNEAGHPAGGRMYVDGAHSHFRRDNPDIVSLFSNPCLSVQRGSTSSLNPRAFGPSLIINQARMFRDNLWRRGLVRVRPKM